MTRAGAVVVPRGESPQALLAGFVAALRGRGVRVGGLMQRTIRDGAGVKIDMELVAVDSGETFPIAQRLGAAAGCSVDTQALAAATAAVRRAIEGRCDLVVVNKFSHLEAEGGGLADEAMAVMAEGLPLLIGVGAEYIDRWLVFCGGQCDLLAPDEAALWRWWDRQRPHP